MGHRVTADGVIVYPIAPFDTRRGTIGSILRESIVVRELLCVCRREFQELLPDYYGVQDRPEN